MLKQFFALVRGRSYEAAEAVVDRNALVILRQQIRDCADAIAAARRAVAIAIAQNEQEVLQFKKLVVRIDDLEKRAIAAIEQGQNELAREAAETIAMLEAERDASSEAQKSFSTEIERLKRTIRVSEMRLRELQRGQRIVAAVDSTQRLRESAPGSSLSALQDAEETLLRLRTRQKHIDATAAAMAEMEQSGDPAAVSEKLAAAGCGAPLRSSAEAVLERLAAKMAKPA
ncbi:PspA/IM30 family protein [Mesorhizobium sp. 128a]